MYHLVGIVDHSTFLSRKMGANLFKKKKKDRKKMEREKVYDRQ